MAFADDVRFYVRGSVSADAYFSRGDHRHGLTQQSKTAGYGGLVADAGAIGSSAIKLGNPAASVGITWLGRENCPTTQAFTVIIRMKVFSQASMAGLFGMGTYGGGSTGGYPGISYGLGNTSHFRSRSTITTGSVALNSSDIDYTGDGMIVDGSSYVDVTWTNTRATAANGFNIYIGQTLAGSSTNSFASATPIDTLEWGVILLGFNAIFNQSNCYVSELLILDNIWSPANIPLVGGGTGLSTGRTAFIDVSNYQGLSWPVVASTLTTQTWREYGVLKTGLATLPTASNVKTGSGLYGVSGTGSTPSLTVPSLANTKTGVDGDGGTGTYDGSDRWTAPAAGDLRNGTQLKNNSTSLNLTGTLVAPALSDTKVGVSGDGGVGTYDGSDRHTDPGISNVLSGIQYKSNSATNNRTGTHAEAVSTDPGEANVLTGTEYMIDDVELVGTLIPGLSFSTLRGFLNYILDEIGTSSLTDDEFDTISLTNPDYEFNTETYEALVPVLESREDVSTTKDRLEYLFLAKGAAVVAPTDDASGIYMGDALDVDDGTDPDEDVSNIYVGGVLED